MSAAAVNISILNCLPPCDNNAQQRLVVAGPSGAIPTSPSPSPPISLHDSESENTPTELRIPSPAEYQSIGSFLHELHDGTMLAHFNLPQYEPSFLQHGITTVADIFRLNDSRLIELGLPSDTFLLKALRDRAGHSSLMAEGHGVSQSKFY